MDDLVRTDRQWQTPAHGDPLAAILELRARVEALEATRRPASKVHEISEPLQLTPEQAQQVRDLLAPNSKPTPNLSQIRSSLQLTPEQETEIAALLRPDHFGQANKMVAGSLVERLMDLFGHQGAGASRAAIREVAAWLREAHGWEQGAQGLEREAERG
jgi:hypothetical protein